MSTFSPVRDALLTFKSENFIKQFVKFTDFGHVASAICYFYPPFLPVAHNIHFVITSVYWIARFIFNVQDCSDIIHPEIIQSYSDFWSFQGHSIPYILILDKLKKENYYFNNYTLLCSYVWMYFWIIFIYYPWRTLTKDPVYTNLKEKIPYFGFFVIHLFFILANELGKINFNKIDKVCLN